MKVLRVLVGLIGVFSMLGCEGELGGTGGESGTPPFDTSALSCEYDFVNDRLGGVHYWLLGMDGDGNFTASYPTTAADTVTGHWDAHTGALTADITYDDGYQLTGAAVSGSLTFTTDGELDGELSYQFTYRDGWVEDQQHVIVVLGCERFTEMTLLNRDGESVMAEITTTFTGSKTADEVIEGTVGDDGQVHYESSLYEDYTRGDQIEMDDLSTEMSPDQILERVTQPDGSGVASYVTEREDGGSTTGNWIYDRDGDQEGDWEIESPQAPANPVAWGHTIQYLDGSGESEYSRQGAQGTTVQCTSEWAADGSGTLDCDDGTHEEF